MKKYGHTCETFKRYTVFTAFTPNTIYEDGFAKLHESCKRLSIPLEYMEYPSTGKWVKNTLQKPKLIYQFMKKTNKSYVFWVDSDAVFMKYPTLFDEIAEKRENSISTFSMGSRSRVCSGTVGFYNSLEVGYFISDWLSLCEHDKQPIGDQKCLRELIKSGGTDRYMLKINRLPYEYCYVFDGSLRLLQPELPKLPKDRIVIQHKQYSRKVKK